MKYGPIAFGLDLPPTYTAGREMVRGRKRVAAKLKSTRRANSRLGGSHRAANKVIRGAGSLAALAGTRKAIAGSLKQVPRGERRTAAQQAASRANGAKSKGGHRLKRTMSHKKGGYSRR